MKNEGLQSKTLRQPIFKTVISTYFVHEKPGHSQTVYLKNIIYMDIKRILKQLLRRLRVTFDG